MTIDLRTCKPGDRLRRRDGEVVKYEQDCGHREYQHVAGRLNYTDRGFFWPSETPYPADIIAILPRRKKTKKAKPVKKDRDAEWLRRLAGVYADHYRHTTIKTHVPRRLRAIANRLERASK